MRLRSPILTIAVAVMAVALSTAVILPPHLSAQASKPIVVTSFSILGDLTRQVAGDAVELHSLVGPDADAHTFEPTPADAVLLAKAQLVLVHGMDFDPWFDRLLGASGSRALRVEVSRGLPDPIQAGDHDEHDHGDLDPHVWHDVNNALFMVGQIRDALIRIDGANAAVYQANAARYVGELQTLDRWILDQVGALPTERRKLMTSHESLNYLARRYGFQLIGAALPLSTEAADPFASQVAALVESVKAADVPAIFVENVTNRVIVERIAEAAGVKVAPPLYTDALGAAGGPADTYMKLMQHNIQTIVGALRP
jgi:zinc/manganese transport system substrate-binding protein